MLISAKKNPAGGTKGVERYDLGCVAASTPGPGPYPPKAAATTAAASTGSSASTTTTTSTTTAATAPASEGDNALIICSKKQGSDGDWNWFDRSVLANAGLVDDKGNTLINHVQLGKRTEVWFTEGFNSRLRNNYSPRYDAITTNGYLPDRDDYRRWKTDIFRFKVTTNNDGKLADSCKQF